MKVPNLEEPVLTGRGLGCVSGVIASSSVPALLRRAFVAARGNAYTSHVNIGRVAARGVDLAAFAIARVGACGALPRAGHAAVHTAFPGKHGGGPGRSLRARSARAKRPRAALAILVAATSRRCTK